MTEQKIQLGQKLIKMDETITAVESLTAGLFAATLAETPGISAVFPGAFVTYSATAKTLLTGVPQALIARYGVVSEQVAVAMAFGAAKKMQTDWAISFTGVAGPDSLEGHAAGTVYIGIVYGQRLSYVQAFQLEGDRQMVREAAVSAGMNLLNAVILTPDKYFEKIVTKSGN
ncbi:nicotinamide-nucleotide amidohydrolase family protein [Weissella diestrammenae]|uniref:Nicotinamide-nucleotide amidohydrolase family protein n=1 Tax=Weissella diestrammenae TaxID=1162633 RepID=A0A7G9T5V7_9LACO|nr:nicotinamide-nucleotide amidohydrolase family protein [Weissella diestrammenae]MCM0582312.1 nicotinamide-nucleotide amidohydrolase family protein [Weissella diestrammenae]QNN75482.1 nicotinamide-nucleotide amidohydrolase family protein [Weissella diestrammenae]